MKLSNKKIIVSTLALAMGAALAGSISGSVAWYQYSTRATAQLSGTTVATSRNLQISTNGSSWGWDLTDEQVRGSQSGNLKPVGGVVAAATNAPDTAKFSGFGVRQYALPAALTSEYLSFDVYLKSTDETGALEAVDIYLETFNVTFTDASTKLANALRIAIVGGDTNLVLSKVAGTTTTKGHLDLNQDGCDDRDIFSADDRTGLAQDPSDENKWKIVQSEVPADGAVPANRFEDPNCSTPASGTIGDVGAGAEYASGTTFYYFGDEPGDVEFADKTGTSGKYLNYVTDTSVGATNTYETTAWSGVVSTFSDAYTVSGTKIGSTTEGNSLHLQFVIWLEGWEEIDGDAIWSNSLRNKDFSIQMRFQTPAERN